MTGSLTGAMLVLAAAVVSATGAAAQPRPVAPGWQELAVTKETAGIAVQSRIDSEVVGLKFNGGNVEVLRTDPPLLAVDKRRIMLDHVALAEAMRSKSADDTLGAYRDYVNADLQKRGWREVAAERAKFSAGGRSPAIYWALQTEVGSADKRSTLTVCLAAALAGSSIVAMTAVAENAQEAAANKRTFADVLATLETRRATAMSGDVVDRLRQEAQRLVYPIGGQSGAILLNDELASQQDRQVKSDDIEKYVLSPSDMAKAAALAVGGSPNGPFITFVNDGRSQHTITIHAYDPATDSFDYSDTTGNRSMLEAGNNLAGVEAERKPGTTARLWVVKRDQLQAVLAGMIAPTDGRIFLGDAELTAKSPREITAAGVGIVPEDRHAVGCVTGMSLAENIYLNRLDEFTRFGFLKRTALEREAAGLMQRFDVRARGPGGVGDHGERFAGKGQREEVIVSGAPHRLFDERASAGADRRDSRRRYRQASGAPSRDPRPGRHPQAAGRSLGVDPQSRAGAEARRRSDAFDGRRPARAGIVAMRDRRVGRGRQCRAAAAAEGA